MFEDSLNPKIAKKSMKKNWKIKGKIIYKKTIENYRFYKRRRGYRN